MWVNFVFILIILIVSFIGFTGYSLAKGNNNQNNLSIKTETSRAELNNKLAQLQNFDDKPDERPGAMCYSMAPPRNLIEYTCPVCGEKNLFGFADDFEVNNIELYRSLIEKITKIDVKLDESQLCHKCTPSAKSRTLCLIVKYDKDSKEQKTCDITEEDINLLYEFSEGKKEHTESYSRNLVPMSKYKARLEELLGVKLKDDEKQ